MELMERIMEHAQSGYFCSQILMKLLLETVGEENPALVGAAGGLCGGVGFTSNTCGCLTAGACMISYFTGKREPDGADHPLHREVLAEFVRRFTDFLTERYGGTECMCVLHGDFSQRGKHCPQIMAFTYETVMELLEEKDLIP